MSRYSAYQQTYAKYNLEQLQSSRILIIGAGGIGCELLKNLALIGFHTLEIIDLDTIDVSNLNRQFLFRSHHVGKSKAIIAAEAIKQFNPHVNIISHHGNIKDNQYNISYFKQFNLVLNALDNVDARRHVNRMCLAAGVTLIDSGTTGFLGQVMPIRKGVSACYECKPKPTQKVYPICTIRSTPDKPVHCIVWAKELYKLLFGNIQESMLFEDTQATSDTSTYMDLVKSWSTKINQSDYLVAVKEIIIALYNTEVEKRIAMDVYKTARITPVSIAVDAIELAFKEVMTILENNNVRPTENLGWENQVWTVHQCLVEIFLMFHDLTSSCSELVPMIGKLSFDKDDEYSMKFVYVASTLRSAIFSISTMSFHDNKGIAGNIIPAISTTNAIVAGIQVMQAVKVLLDPDATLSHVYCLREPSSKKLQYLLPTVPDGPESGCYVCNKTELTIEIDTNKFLFGDFINKVLKTRLGFCNPTVVLGASILYEDFSNEDDVDEDDVEFYKLNLTKALADCPSGGIRNDSIISISDSSQSLEVKIVIQHVDNEVLEKSEDAVKVDLFNLLGGNTGNKSATITAESSKTENSTNNEDDEIIDNEDDLIIVEPAVQETHKRERSEVEDSENTNKRMKVN